MILDFETQGVDPLRTNPTEIAAVTFEYPFTKTYPASSSLDELGVHSRLIWEESYPAQTKEIVELTGITDEMLKAGGVPLKEAFRPLVGEARHVDYILAHNAEFDKTIFQMALKRLGLDPDCLCSHKWICTLHDIPYPDKYKCRKLSHLAYDHGILVDPGTLHRALDDVRLLARLVAEYPLEDILAYRAMPWAYLKADILGPWKGPGGDGGKGKALATALGYSWERARGTDAPTFDKAWVLRVKESRIEAHTASAPFPVTRIYERKF